MKLLPKFPFHRYLSFLVVLLSCVLRLDAQAVIEPIAPGELLAILPPHPKGWKVTQSRSSKNLSAMNTPEVTASRKYRIVLDEEGATTTFSLDVAEMGARESIVKLLRENIEAQTLEKKPGVQAFDAGPISGIIREREGKPLSFQGTTGPRLIIRATATDVDVDAFKKLLGMLDWSRLVQAANRLPERKNDTNRFVVGQIDELNPQTNRSTSISVFEPPEGYVPPIQEPVPLPPEILGP